MPRRLICEYVKKQEWSYRWDQHLFAYFTLQVSGVEWTTNKDLLSKKTTKMFVGQSTWWMYLVCICVSTNEPKHNGYVKK